MRRSALNCFAYLYAALLALRRSDSVEMWSHIVRLPGKSERPASAAMGDIDWLMPNCEHCFDSTATLDALSRLSQKRDALFKRLSLIAIPRESAAVWIHPHASVWRAAHSMYYIALNLLAFKFSNSFFALNSNCLPNCSVIIFNCFDWV